MTKNQILILILLIVLVGGVLYFASDRQAQPEPEVNLNDNENIEEVVVDREMEGNVNDLVSFSVKPNQEVSGILAFNGSVKNAYFFEANIGINILDENKNLLKAGNAMATTDWMTVEPVSFSGTIDLTGLPPGPGYIEIHNDNASGLPENDKSILIPIIIG